MKRLRFTVCRGPECGKTSADLTSALRERIEALGVGERVEVDHFSCFGRCRVGPNVVVRELPEGAPKPRLGFGLAAVPGAGRSTMYNQMTPDQVVLLLHRRLTGQRD